MTYDILVASSGGYFDHPLYEALANAGCTFPASQGEVSSTELRPRCSYVSAVNRVRNRRRRAGGGERHVLHSVELTAA